MWYNRPGVVQSFRCGTIIPMWYNRTPHCCAREVVRLIGPEPSSHMWYSHHPSSALDLQFTHQGFLTSAVSTPCLKSMHHKECAMWWMHNNPSERHVLANSSGCEDPTQLNLVERLLFRSGIEPQIHFTRSGIELQIHFTRWQ